MRNSRTFLRGAAVAMLAAAVLVPPTALARGGGFARGGHGPVFGFAHAPIVAHRPFRPAVAHHVPGRFAHGWRLHRFARHRGSDRNGIADAGYAAGTYPGSTYNPGDFTGTVAPPPAVFVPPLIPPPPAERVGCLSRGYDVPGESGGVVRVVVTRC
jgi:hypothetical protein